MTAMQNNWGIKNILADSTSKAAIDLSKIIIGRKFRGMRHIAATQVQHGGGDICGREWTRRVCGRV